MELGDLAAIGGAGAGTQLVLRLIGMGTNIVQDAVRTNREIEAAKNKEELDRWAKTKELTKTALNGAGAWVYRMFAVAAGVVILSTILLPFCGDLKVTFYAPDAHGWWVFKKELLREYTFGEGKRHIAIFPFQVSFALNVIWFYICGRPLKHGR